MLQILMLQKVIARNEDNTCTNQRRRKSAKSCCKMWKNTCWIGLVEHGGTWKWLDGETLSYSNWNEGEPNNWQGNDEKNAIMNCCDEDVESPNGKWHDVSEGFESPRPLCEENVTTYQNPCVNGVQNATQSYNVKTITVKCDYLDESGQEEGIATDVCDTLLGKSPTNINEGCLETFKTTDHNTCKDFGMDIVIPRSKKHWKNYLLNMITPIHILKQFPVFINQLMVVLLSI